MIRSKFGILVVTFSLVASCASPPNDVAMKIGGPPVEEGKTSLDLRNLQIRRFDSLDEQRLLHAGIQTLQDLGFTVTESSAEVGVLVGSKQRDAEESGQVAGQIVLTLFAAALGSAHNPTWDKEQSIFVTFVSTPIENSKQTEVRISFERRLTNNHGKLWRAELILDPKIHQEFFTKFSQGTFLEAHKL